MIGEAIYIGITIICVMLLGFLMILAAGGFDDVASRRSIARQHRMSESAKRQKYLRESWIEDQCRINPNMKYIYSGASFEKESRWQLEQTLASMEPMTRAERRQMTLMLMQNPSMKPEKMTRK